MSIGGRCMIKQLILSEKEREPESRLFASTRSLVYAGLIGIFLSLLFLTIIIIHGSLILPDGNLYKPFSFNAALGLFVINLAAFLPLANFTGRGRALWKGWMFFAAMGAYLIESVQPLRGVDPRFARNGDVMDILIGAVGMTFFSILIMILTIIYAWKMFQSHSIRRTLVYGIRWSMTLIFIGFCIGIVMMFSVLLADYRGQYDKFLWIAAHGFAFHSLQIFPLVAMLLEGKTNSARKIINTTGAIWITIIVLLNLQTYIGDRVWEGRIFLINTILIAVYLGILLFSAKIFKSVRSNIGVNF
jgi:hypothetical protein